MTHRLAVLISGTGSNLQAILDAIDAGELPARVSLVLSNKAGAAGLARAERAGVPAQAIDHRGFPDRASFDQAMIERIDAHGADTVVLAGFMRILSPGFVRHYQGRLINIHPSCCPSTRGSTPTPGRWKPATASTAARCISSPTSWTAAR
jgi:phosphoribosylglycinamide formyltransferase-1